MVITSLELLTLADVQAFGCCTIFCKLEVQVKELENSNRILRMKVVRSDDAVQHIKVNTNENMHTVPHCGPKRDENLHYTHQWQRNSVLSRLFIF
jgi:hypothetical protein